MVVESSADEAPTLVIATLTPECGPPSISRGAATLPVSVALWNPVKLAPEMSVPDVAGSGSDAGAKV